MSQESTEFDDVARKFASQARGPCDYEVSVDTNVPLLNTPIVPIALSRGKAVIDAYRQVLDNAIVRCSRIEHADGISRLQCRIASGNVLNNVADVDIIARPRDSKRRSWFWPAF